MSTLPSWNCNIDVLSMTDNLNIILLISLILNNATFYNNKRELMFYYE